MTKQLKKGLMTVLMFVLSLTLCFTATNAIVKADASDPAAVAAFETAVAGIEKTAYDTSLLADSDWVKALKAVNKAWVELGDDQTYVDEEVKAEFKEAWAVIEKPYQIEVYFTSDLYNKLNNVEGNKLYKSDEARFLEMKAEYNLAIADANVATYLNSRAGLTDNITAATNKFVDIDSAILAAKNAIADIQYANDAGDNLNVFSATNNRIVLGSETTIGLATAALKDIYGVDFATVAATEAGSVDGYATKYLPAVEALAAQKALAAEVNVKIEKLATEKGVSIANGQVWTKKADIEAVETAYDALEDSTYNNLKALVTKYPTLETYSNRLDAIGGADRTCQTAGEIYEVNVLIDAIGTVVYTSASLNKITTAENAFGGLDADIRLADTAEGATTYIVAKYPVLVAARDAYNTLKADVDAFKTAVDNMANVVDVLGEFNNVLVPRYEALDPEQLAAIKVDTQANGTTTYYNAYLAWQAKAGSIYSAAQPVIQLIKDMMNAAPADFAEAFADAENAYNALEASVQAAVTNRQDLFDKRAELDGEATAWRNAVAAIVTPVVLDNMDKVATAVTAYGDMSADMQLIVTAMFSDDYTKYDGAKTAMETMLGAIKAVADKMALLSVDANIALGDMAAGDPAVLDIIEFKNAVESVKLDYEALVEVDGNKQQSYLQEKYETEYARYLTASSLNERYAVEAAIAAIYTDDAVTITDGALISEAEALYNDYAGEAEVRNAAKLTEARTAYDAITTKLTTWVANVLALKGDKTVAELISVDLSVVADLADQYLGNGGYTAFTADEIAATVKVEEVDYVVSAVKTTLDEIDAQGKAVATTLKNDIAAFLTAHSQLTTQDIPAIEALNSRYNAITLSQQKLVDNYDAFQGAYSKLNFKTFFGNAVAKLTDEVAGDVYTAEGAVMIDILKALYAGAGVELQKLAADEYEDLLEVIAAYEEANALVDYATLKAELVAIIDELKNGQVATNATNIATNAGKIATLEGKVSTLETTVAGIDAKYVDNAELQTAITEVKGLITDITKDGGLLATAKQAAIDAAKAYTDELANGAVADNAAAIAQNIADIEALEAAIGDLGANTTVVDEIAAAKQTAIDAAKVYTDGLITEVKGLITALKNTEVKANADAIAKEVADRAAEIARLEGVMATDTELSDAIAAAKAEIKAVTDALDAAIKAEAAERAEADAAIKADLEAAVAQLNKTITIITVILGVVSLGMAGCLVFIFLKKRA